MTLDQFTAQFQDLLMDIARPFANFQSLFVLIIALIGAYLLNLVIASLTPRLGRLLTNQADSATTRERLQRIRRAETFLSLGSAVGRVVVILLAVAWVWHKLQPDTAPIALVGVSTVFIIVASATISPLLRDITYGTIMIAERWYNVGDHIVVEPFASLGGVVEKINLRATKIRSVNGEIIWVHHQHIQGVRVSSAASHTIAIETFVSDPKEGEKIINNAIKVIPTGSTTLPMPPSITEIKKIEDGLWRITAVCEITPFREWIVDDYGTKAIKETAERNPGGNVIVHGPVAYYADATAENRYTRAVRTPRRKTS